MSYHDQTLATQIHDDGLEWKIDKQPSNPSTYGGNTTFTAAGRTTTHETGAYREQDTLIAPMASVKFYQEPTVPKLDFTQLKPSAFEDTFKEKIPKLQKLNLKCKHYLAIVFLFVGVCFMAVEGLSPFYYDHFVRLDGLRLAAKLGAEFEDIEGSAYHLGN